jgi:hypothetical protein
MQGPVVVLINRKPNSESTDGLHSVRGAMGQRKMGRTGRISKQTT